MKKAMLLITCTYLLTFGASTASATHKKTLCQGEVIKAGYTCLNDPRITRGAKECKDLYASWGSNEYYQCGLNENGGCLPKTKCHLDK